MRRTLRCSSAYQYRWDGAFLFSTLLPFSVPLRVDVCGDLAALLLFCASSALYSLGKLIFQMLLDDDLNRSFLTMN